MPFVFRNGAPLSHSPLSLEQEELRTEEEEVGGREMRERDRVIKVRWLLWLAHACPLLLPGGGKTGPEPAGTGRTLVSFFGPAKAFKTKWCYRITW